MGCRITSSSAVVRAPAPPPPSPRSGDTAAVSLEGTTGGVGKDTEGEVALSVLSEWGSSVVAGKLRVEAGVDACDPSTDTVDDDKSCEEHELLVVVTVPAEARSRSASTWAHAKRIVSSHELMLEP